MISCFTTGWWLLTSAVLMFNLEIIFILRFKVDEANSQREISSSHSHLWPATITKYVADLLNKL